MNNNDPYSSPKTTEEIEPTPKKPAPIALKLLSILITLAACSLHAASALKVKEQVIAENGDAFFTGYIGGSVLSPPLLSLIVLLTLQIVPLCRKSSSRHVIYIALMSFFVLSGIVRLIGT